MEIESIPLLNKRYRENKQKNWELTDIFMKVLHTFMNVNSKRNFSRFGQSSWQSFIKEARLIKYGIAITNTNLTSPAQAVVQTQEETKES